MSGDLVILDKANLPVELADMLGGGEDANDDLSAGVSGGFSVVSFRGAKWRVKHGGEETVLTDDEGDPIPTIKVLMLKANKHISKNYYEGAYVEGSDDSPSCWSVDGIKPDAGVEKPINPTCPDCPKNKFGSRITDTGSKAKACGDSRRVAVVPEGDYKNEMFDGPMLLRVPAASLSDLATYGKAMKLKGFPYNTIITKIAFDPDASYPKLKFSAFRPLKEGEDQLIMKELRDPEYMERLNYVLAEPMEVQAPAKASEPEPEPAPPSDPTEFEQPAEVDDTAAKKETAAAKKRAKAAKAAAAKKAGVAALAPVPTEEEVDAEVEAEAKEDDDLDAILATLDDLD